MKNRFCAIITYLIVLCFFDTSFFFAQNKIGDSIYKKLQAINVTEIINKKDTSGVMEIGKLAFALQNINPDSTIAISKRVILISEKLDFINGKVNAYNTCGIGYWVRGDFSKAIEYFSDALKLNTAINNENGMANNYNNMALVYSDKTEYSKALELYFKALAICERNKFEKITSSVFVNIGLVYSYQNEYKKALDFYFKALNLNKKNNDKASMSVCYSNIGNVYKKMKQYPQALNYFQSAYQIAEQSGNMSIMANNLSNMAAVYMVNNENDKALNYYKKALESDQKMGRKLAIAIDMNNIGTTYSRMNQYKEAEKYLAESLKISEEIDDIEGIKECNFALSELYDKLHQPEKAYKHYKKYIIFRDSINSEKNIKKQIEEEQRYEYEKKETILKAQQEQERAIAKTEKRHQQAVLIFVVICMLLAVGFGVYVWRSLKQSNQQNNIIVQQKKIVEEKNKEVLDSITYAQRIQNSILPQENELNKLLNYFIYYQPKDIISGDFYFVKQVKSKLWFAVADCTGHGVPGSLVSMICSQKLSDAVEQADTPAAVLKYVNREVKRTLQQDTMKDATRDGMDIALCCMEKSDVQNIYTQLQYAGANRPLWIIKSNNALLETKPDKMAIGGFTDDTMDFTNHRYELNKNDIIYLFSDGYVDQPGGEKSKKLKISGFRNFIISIAHLSLQEQHKEAEIFIHKWMNKNEQIDDFCIMGVKV